MPKSQSSSSDPIAVKLLEADAELVQQEIELAAQLEAIRDKRKSLEVVLHMFGSGGSTSATAAIAATALADAAPADTSSDSESAEAPSQRAGRRGPGATTTTKSKASSTKEPKAKPGPKPGKAAKPTKEAKAPSTRGKRGDKSAPAPTAPTKSSASSSTNWQDYVRQEYRHQSLPQAVLTVLQEKPDGMVEVTYIMDTIFMDSIPKEARLNARDRLSNVLSVGLKNNKWYRGRTGLYSLSKSAADASLAS